MPTINRNPPPSILDVEAFLAGINFILPQGFIEFYKESNGGEVIGEELYVALWPLTDLIKLNLYYKAAVFIPDFFIFGSDGGGEAFVVEKKTGYIFQIPFIGMLKEDAIFKSKNFNEFIETI
jgi:hypothetical protein